MLSFSPGSHLAGISRYTRSLTGLLSPHTSSLQLFTSINTDTEAYVYRDIVPSRMQAPREGAQHDDEHRVLNPPQSVSETEINSRF